MNPDTIVAQIESEIVYGLNAALYNEITIKNGRVEQSNFNDYPMMRMSEMPKVEVHILQGQGDQGGIGEPGTPPIAPAVCNAIFAATGKRIRKLPIKPELLSARKMSRSGEPPTGRAFGEFKGSGVVCSSFED